MSTTFLANTAANSIFSAVSSASMLELERLIEGAQSDLLACNPVTKGSALETS